jgi:nitrous oxidase accessory protein NosD
VVSHFDGVIVSKNVFHKSRDLRIQKSTNVVISENEMLSCLSAGIGVNKSERVQIMNNKIQSCRLAIGLVDVGDVEIFKNSFTDWRPLRY